MPTQLDLSKLAWHHANRDHHGLLSEPKPALIGTFTARLILNPTNEGGKTRPTPVGEYRPVLMLPDVQEGASCRIRYEGQLEPGSETTVTVDLLVPVSELPDHYLVWESRIVGSLYPIR